MLKREVPGKWFLTLGPSRVVNPIDTTKNKILPDIEHPLHQTANQRPLIQISLLWPTLQMFLE